MALTRAQQKDVVRFYKKHAYNTTTGKTPEHVFGPLGDAAEQANDLLVAQKGTINAAFTGPFGADATLQEKAIMVAGAALKIAGVL